MVDIAPQYLPLLNKFLPPSRVEHSLRVADTAKALAKVWRADGEKAYVAGLVHDIAKSMDPGYLKVLEISYDSALDQLYDSFPAIWHAFVGPDVVRSLFSITDTEILAAVRWHTTGCADMPLLAKVVYTADFIEPGRGAATRAFMAELAHEALESAVYGITLSSLLHLLRQGFHVHPYTIECLNYYRDSVTSEASARIRTVCFSPG